MARTIHVALIGGKFHTDNIASDTLAGHCQILARDGSFDLFAPVEVYQPHSGRWVQRFRSLVDATAASPRRSLGRPRAS